ncbi:hypothetical protein BHE75_03031 [Sphingomonas haloaromaticamans]|uniref:DUF1570 domain-containing protein n=1 Tax=Edaphosphingomonas haloaromaticamans TaxID=653954 RepID=A0A1S1HHW4_9SPHN|nr:hypothetical protein BHE75_03031 [Sphingomonas haloaromaticamans]
MGGDHGIRTKRSVRRGWSLLALLAAGLSSGTAHAAWLKAETEHFRIYSEGGEAQLRTFASKLEDYDRILRLVTGTKLPPAPGKLDIYLVGSNADLRQVRPVSASVAGFYSATPGAIAAFAIRRDRGGLDGDEVLQHEYTHHFMLQYYPMGYPAWYVEGFAEYMMTADILEKEFHVGRYNAGRGYMLVNAPWLPVQRILDGNAEGLNSLQMAQFYAQSWLITHWMFGQKKHLQLKRYLAARNSGEDSQAVFQREFGMNYAEFTKALKTYVSRPLTYLKIGRPEDWGPASVTITALPKSADDLLLPGAGISLGIDEERGRPMLARVRKAAAAFPGDRLAMATRAEIELDVGDVATGRTLAEKLVAGEGAQDARALFLRGYADLSAARKLEGQARAPLYDSARKWFVRAFKADKYYVPALWAYVETRSLEPLSDNDLNVLLEAQRLAPQVDELRGSAAVALMQKRYFDEAARMIEPLAADPHGGGSAARARALLAMAKKHEPLSGAVQSWEGLATAAEADAGDEGTDKSPAPQDKAKAPPAG